MNTVYMIRYFIPQSYEVDIVAILLLMVKQFHHILFQYLTSK